MTYFEFYDRRNRPTPPRADADVIEWDLTVGLEAAEESFSRAM